MSDALAVGVVPVEQDDSNEWLIAWAIVLLLVNGNVQRPLSPVQRKRARDLLRTKFESDVTRNATQVTSGDLSIDEWQLAMGGLIADYTRQMAVAGAGTMPNASVRQSAAVLIAEQAPFLARFAQVIAQGAMSAGRVAARSKQYGGSGWAMYHVAQGSTAGDGIVEQWLSRDDGNTCPICSARNGKYYLPGQGPMPATDCYGAGNCRCERVQVVNREIWARLSGRRAR